MFILTVQLEGGELKNRRENSAGRNLGMDDAWQ